MQVLIGPESFAVVDGEPFVASDGEPVQGVVLDAVHRLARDRGKPVEAVITDRNEGHTTRVEVALDGSSRVLRQRGDREPPARPAATMDQQGSGAGTPIAVPEVLADLVARVVDAIDAGARERAAALAFLLREHAARTFGAEHPYALEARALEAFAAHRGGNHRLATATCLDLASIRHRQGDPRAHEELMRATAGWRLIDDAPSAVAYGRTLLALWSQVVGPSDGSAPDAALVWDVNRRIHAVAMESPHEQGGAA